MFLFLGAIVEGGTPYSGRVLYRVSGLYSVTFLLVCFLNIHKQVDPYIHSIRKRRANQNNQQEMYNMYMIVTRLLFVSITISSFLI